MINELEGWWYIRSDAHRSYIGDAGKNEVSEKPGQICEAKI